MATKNRAKEQIRANLWSDIQEMEKDIKLLQERIAEYKYLHACMGADTRDRQQIEKVLWPRDVTCP